MKPYSFVRTFQFLLRTGLVATLMAAPFFAAAQNSSARFIGAVTSVQGDLLTVKTDAGDRKVQVLASTVLKRIAPGQTDLSTAETIALTALVNGDRVLVRIDPNVFSTPQQAIQVVVIKQEDVAQKQQRERDEWQRRGVGGLVKSVDAASGIIIITNGTSSTSVTVNVAKNTTLRRYSAGSVRYDDAKPAPLGAILVGDQLRARGNKSADGHTIDAEEIVSGTFRNLSGLITSIDSAKKSLVIKDLATKKQITILITAESQLRRLPENAAAMLAARLKSASAEGEQPQATNGNAAAHRAGPAADPQQMLSRLAPIQLEDLKSGEAIMVVATGDDGTVDAVSILAGVQTMLEAPAAKNLLANWSMGSGESD